MSKDNSMRETTEPVVRDYKLYKEYPVLVRMLERPDSALHDSKDRELYKFQHIYKDVKAELDTVSYRLASLLRMTFSLEHAEHVLYEFTAVKKRVCVMLDKASDLSCMGEEMMQTSIFGEYIIEPSCCQLRAISKELSSNLRIMDDYLRKTMKLHRCLKQVSQWVDDNMFVLMPHLVHMCHSRKGAALALQELENVENESRSQMSDLRNTWATFETVLNQQFKDQVEEVLQKQMYMQESIGKCRVSLKKVAAKHNRVVQPVAPRGEDVINSPPSSPAHGAQQEEACSSSRDSSLASLSEEEEKLMVSRRHIMAELLDTERAYVEDLLCVLQGCASEMDNPAMSHLIPPPLKNEKHFLLGNMAEIYDFHSNTFLRELEKYIDCPELVGRCFLERMKDLQMYEVYILNKPSSEQLWIKYSDCTFFQECQKNLKRWLGLDSYLLMPVQRLTTYQLVLKDMLKYSTHCEGAADLQEALTSISAILDPVNDSLHRINIRGFKGNLNELGKLLMQGSFTVWKDHKRRHGKFPYMSRVQPKQRHLFLFENALVFCKRREEKGKGHIYVCMSDVDIDVNFNTFEIWCTSRKKVYVVEAPSAEIKTTWVSELKKVVAAQREACREASQQRAPDQGFSETESLRTPPTDHKTGCNRILVSSTPNMPHPNNLLIPQWGNYSLHLTHPHVGEQWAAM